jgi:integrase/recombinase XerD
MTVSRVLDKKRKTLTGENAGRYHIKIRLTRTEDKRTIQRYYKTGIFATVDEFKKMLGNVGNNTDLQEKQSRLNAIYENAKGILRDNPFIDFQSFGTELLQSGGYKNPLALMEMYAKQLRAEGKPGTASFYEQAASSFKSYCPYFTFGSVTPAWLMKYERWMVEGSAEKDNERAPRSITTVGMYTTALRTIFNLAKSKGKIPAKMYPFGKGKYKIPTAKGRKLALTEEQKNSALFFKSNTDSVQKAVDFFIFSYFCYGMNFKDIALLKFKDIKDDAIFFDRAKTINTERDRSFIEIPLREETRVIIKNRGNFKHSMNPNAFVFPILRDELTPEQIKQRVHDFIRDTNEGLKELAKHLKLTKITTYWARHTFATIAWKKGADLIFIQRALGHSDPKTTQRYLDSFDIETKRKVANLL